MLQLKSISKRYTTGEFTQTALDNVDLSFRENEFVAILGPSGSGKTTCLNVIGGLDRYDEGDLIINGRSTRDFKDGDWDAYRNNSVGFIFQSYNLISHMSIVGNVEMGMTLSGIGPAARRSKAEAVLERVGLKEHLHKKPGQLSGGQMQRVAIARALANDPDIILADEPTGALDTATSEQILELIREIASDKLVVMVTHNPDLAQRYAGRIVEFRDGQIVSDSNPPETEAENPNYRLKKTAMSYLTALKLSGRNVLTKKWRTALTAFASSIGIIGIALILSLSNGFDKQISTYESGALSNFPVTISRTAANVDLSAGPPSMRDDSAEGLPEFPSQTEVYPHDPSINMVLHSNKITDEYLQYLNGIEPGLLDGVSYTRQVNMNVLKKQGNAATEVDLGEANFTAYPSKPTGTEGSYLEQVYDVLAGSYPASPNDLVLVVDEYNRVDTSVLEALGFDYEAPEISFDDIVGREYKLIGNDEFYKQAGGGLFALNGSAADLSNLYDSAGARTLTISGIVREKADSPMSTLDPGIGYSDELAEDFIDGAEASAIVLAQEKNTAANVLSGQPFRAGGLDLGGAAFGPAAMMRGVSGGASDPADATTQQQALAALGASAEPASISLYPKDFNAKEKIVAYLDRWNEGREDEAKIVYTDLAATVTSLSSGIMNGITIVLIAFASISLFVSLIMIGIITYISVLERTKEIGVLRALGARKKDITRVFNAETFIIGAASGLLGIGIAYLLTIPINMVLKSLTDLSGVAVLNPLHALLLVVLSVGLTMLGGFIPAKFASRKDPVAALRSE
ncbi:ABC transporter ATP-binding protein/permease [Saccharibacillus sp. CPCC 101409]|uniref:ABC transporter ATP-binding protein/permease n=1 Tax=Saccharibacillus sp. CPCC 101409 TaxID=3058041 RepID=UPI0026732412|nr:ABC transporter ATP-binding protein/permease [Saccharibacillus sp. CPCC 101409]MDO3411802.1 ABC transporter ATP-binding protein/permease [Saccharibacillus sp. CPCC 101409]